MASSPTVPDRRRVRRLRTHRGRRNKRDGDEDGSPHDGGVHWAVRLGLIVVLLAVLSYPVGLALGVPGLLPVLNAAPAYAAMVLLLRRGELRRAVFVMLAWAAALAVAGTVTFAVWPQPPGPLILHGPAYRDEMFTWIRTGAGSEGSPRLFVPQHALHLAAFVALSLVTASALSITMGAVLMNYMDFTSHPRARGARCGRSCCWLAALGHGSWAPSACWAWCWRRAAPAAPGVDPHVPPSSRPFVIAATSLLLADVVREAAARADVGTGAERRPSWLAQALPAVAAELRARRRRVLHSGTRRPRSPPVRSFRRTSAQE